MKEVEVALGSGLWRLALTSTLALPDICAALDSPNGRTSGKKYAAWVNKWLGDKYGSLDGKELYGMRCSYLHQGRTEGSQFRRTLFTLPGSSVKLHNNIVGNALNLDLVEFCNDVMEAVRDWRASKNVEDHNLVNWVSLMRVYPRGLRPYIEGVPLIS